MATDELARLVVRLEAETSSLRRDLEQVDARLKKSGDAMRSLGGAWKQVAGYFSVGLFARSVISNTIEAQNVMAQLEAAIKATGGAAGKSVRELDAMSQALQRTTTYSDEAVKGAQAILLTFKQVRGDEFDEATRAVLNLATRMGGDLKGAALQVGKALEDPTTGLLALRRSGVSFTEAQRDLIKSLVETGHQAEAQRVILKELESQFGGSATAARDTLGGALAYLGDQWGELLEVSRRDSDGIISAIEGIANALPKLREKINQVAVGWQVLGTRAAVLIERLKLLNAVTSSENWFTAAGRKRIDDQRLALERMERAAAGVVAEMRNLNAEQPDRMRAQNFARMQQGWTPPVEGPSADEIARVAKAQQGAADAIRKQREELEKASKAAWDHSRALEAAAAAADPLGRPNLGGVGIRQGINRALGGIGDPGTGINFPTIDADAITRAAADARKEFDKVTFKGAVESFAASTENVLAGIFQGFGQGLAGLGQQFSGMVLGLGAQLFHDIFSGDNERDQELRELQKRQTEALEAAAKNLEDLGARLAGMSSRQISEFRDVLSFLRTGRDASGAAGVSGAAYNKVGEFFGVDMKNLSNELGAALAARIEEALRIAGERVREMLLPEFAARGAALGGDDARAAEIRREAAAAKEIQELEELAQAGFITAEQLAEFSAIIKGELRKALDDAADAAKRAADAEAERAEAERQREEERAAIARQQAADFADDIRLRRAMLGGDDLEAIRIRHEIQAQKELAAARALVDAGTITEEMFQLLVALLGDELAEALKKATGAVEEFVDASADMYAQWAANQKLLKEDLDLRKLEALGLDADAARMRLKIQHDREMLEAQMGSGISSQWWDLLREVQRLEREALEKRLAGAATGSTAEQRASEVVRSVANISETTGFRIADILYSSHAVLQRIEANTRPRGGDGASLPSFSAVMGQSLRREELYSGNLRI